MELAREAALVAPGAQREALVLWWIYQRDYPVTQSTILFVAVPFMALNLAVDLRSIYCTVTWSPASATATERLQANAPKGGR